jgi:hypothetical protein
MTTNGTPAGGQPAGINAALGCAKDNCIEAPDAPPVKGTLSRIYTRTRRDALAVVGRDGLAVACEQARIHRDGWRGAADPIARAAHRRLFITSFCHIARLQSARARRFTP